MRGWVAIALAALSYERSAKAHEHPLDEVTLSDGRQVHGRVIEKEPGRWLVVETEDGARRTISWNLVGEIVEAPVAHEVPAVTLPRDPWRERGGLRPNYDLRIALSGMLHAKQTFAVDGTCATGSGVVPASIYGQMATDHGRGGGAGIGGRAGVMFVPQIRYKDRAWWGLRANGGLDLQLLYLRIPRRIPSMDGQLCAEVAKSSHEVRAENVPELVVQVPINLGAVVGLGRLVDASTWKGIVLGAAWAPSFIHVGPWTPSGHNQVSPVGMELTFDFATLQAAAKKRLEEHIRMAATITLPVMDHEALLGTLAFGWVWY